MEGIVPGGGTALIRATDDLQVEVENADQQVGVNILLCAIEAPIRQMALNAGKSPDIICDKVLKQEGNVGYNFLTDTVEDLMEAGVIDPVKVTRTALQNAASVSGTLLTTNCAVIEK